MFTYNGSQTLLDNGPTASDLASTDTSFTAGNGKIFAFDGTSGGAGPAAGDAWVWRPSTPIKGVTKIEVHAGTNDKIWYNGIDGASLGTDTISTVYEGPAITLENLSGVYYGTGTFAPAATAFLAMVKINGVTYIDNRSGSYGANGFHLTFADPGDVGKDLSGNGNHFTATGVQLTTKDIYYDLFLDSPTNNTGTLNPIGRTDSGYDGPHYANCAYDMTATTTGNMWNTNWLDFDAGTGKYQMELQGNGQYYPPYGTMGVMPLEDYAYKAGAIMGSASSPLSFYYGSNGYKYQNGASAAFGQGFANAQGASGTYLDYVFDLDA